MKVQLIRNLGREHVKISLGCNDAYADAKPGQFVMVRIPGGMDPLLSRPFSIHDIVYRDGCVSSMEILFKIVGRGTRKLAQLKQGDKLDVLGPLGRGFDIPEGVKSAFAISGGIGVAPLYFLMTSMEKSGIHRDLVTFFTGGRSKEDLLCLEELSRKTKDLYVTTDDGSLGEKGLVTDAMEKVLKIKCPDVIYACGPLEMLKTVARLASKYRVKCQVSLETVMACGLGACLGCVVKNKKYEDTYAHVCFDGPVFDLDYFKF